MSSATWTPDGLSSNFKSISGQCWRLVEAQHRVSTTKLTDTVEEQEIIEALIDETKPKLPPECIGLDYLLASPFRYAPYPYGSRFRRPGNTPGIYYAAETPEIAAAEMAFYRVLFYAESPDAPWPANAAEYTAFSAEYGTKAAVDLTIPPLDGDTDRWTHLTDYTACQDLESAARSAGAEIIRYQSTRDPHKGCALAILTCRAFTNSKIVSRQTWRIHLGKTGVRVFCEFPASSYEYDQDVFAADPRLADMKWER